MNAGCDKALFGWPCDAEMEKLRDDFARETDPAKQKAIAEAVQVREAQVATHISARPVVPAGARCARTSTGMLAAPAPVFWNIDRQLTLHRRRSGGKPGRPAATDRRNRCSAMSCAGWPRPSP